MERESFGSRFAVIMTLAGSAIGLGNIWRFPYIVGENGGAAFILVYIVSSIFLSLPIFMAEFIIGRRSRANCLGAMKKLAPGTNWKWLGLLAVATPTIIVSYYSVVGGWSLDYIVKSLSMDFVKSSESEISSMFGNFISSTWTPILFFTMFLLMGAGIVAGGVKTGIEKFSKICLPLLFLLVILITIYSVSMPGAYIGVEYLLKPDLSKLTLKTCAYAIGQSFYSLSLGMGIVITYSSYVSKKENILVAGIGTAIFDLLFALLAGFAIMPAVFAVGIVPSSGPGLVFEALPHVFSSMSHTSPLLSALASILFFVTIFIAALTSTVSLLEVGVAYLIEEKHLKRWKASLAIFAATWVMGIFSSLSFGVLKDVKLLDMNIFDMFDTFSSNILLTVGGLMGVVFVGWFMKRSDVEDEFTNGGTKPVNKKWFGLIYFLMRYLAPIAVAIIFISNFIW